jgi:hypothetical protein
VLVDASLPLDAKLNFCADVGRRYLEHAILAQPTSPFAAPVYI